MVMKKGFSRLLLGSGMRLINISCFNAIVNPFAPKFKKYILPTFKGDMYE